jgi:hypothetical protein
MNILRFNHPDISANENTGLTQQANAGDTTLTVLDSIGFAINKLLLVGALGADDTEIVKTHTSTPPTQTLITLAAALLMNHPTDTPVALLDWDQIEISKATAKGGTYTVIATINITPDEDGTTYKDTGGLTTDYYRIRFINSIDATFSGNSAEFPATGFTDETLAGMVQAIYNEFSKQSNKLLRRTDIVRWLNEGYMKVATAFIDQDIDYYIKYGTDGNGGLIPFLAGQRSYSVTGSMPDFVRAKRWDFTFDGVNFYPADPIDSTFDNPASTYVNTTPKYYYEASNIVPRPLPTQSVGGMRPRYVYLPPLMTTDDMVPDLPPGRRTILVNYALQKAFQADNKMDTANYYGTLFQNDTEAILTLAKNRYPEMPNVIPMFGMAVEPETNMGDGFHVPGY